MIGVPVGTPQRASNTAGLCEPVAIRTPVWELGLDLLSHSNQIIHRSTRGPVSASEGQ